jgi:RNA polymerase sigma factor (sigma-70 family)
MTDVPFITHRSLLFTLAYEMLGSAADAEDVVQETWLRWADVDHAQVRDSLAYLIRIATRQALNRLRTLARRREEYVGEWLSEPLLTSSDVAEDVEFAESVPIAMLTVLETLAPAERAVFVLREVFDLPYADISAAVDYTRCEFITIGCRRRRYNRSNHSAKKDGSDGRPDESGRAGRQGVHCGEAQGQDRPAPSNIAQEASSAHASSFRRAAAVMASLRWHPPWQDHGRDITHRRQRGKTRLLRRGLHATALPLPRTLETHRPCLPARA